MKRIILSVLVLCTISVFSIPASDDAAEVYGCDCAGAPVTVIACLPENCARPQQPIDVYLMDVDCNMSVGSCTITATSTCCTLTTSACSDHKFYLKYGTQLGAICSTATFTLTGNPHTAYITCSCP